MLKPGAPFPRVRLPENFVARPDALNVMKQKLLAADDQTLVVSAISGLGGLGKSVLATALVLDQQVQARFDDGILWVTLGQQPDLQTLLGDWIRQLDKSRQAFSANTLESASLYLQRLLAARRMLLVVDDVWNAAHVEPFRVGGPECRMLVTTRTAIIADAAQYRLNLMSPTESVALMRGELGQQWTASMEKPARELAQVLGYLPLALRLMAVQVKRGRLWEQLQQAFLRQAEGLRSLDHPAMEYTAISEDERRQYSLRSCFGLSLQWLAPELLQRFIGLGVLPEDAIIQPKMAMTLWQIEEGEAEETLQSLYESSLLTAAPETVTGEPTYRMHDLLHLIAQDLIEHPQTPPQNDQSTQNLKSTMQTLPGLGLSLAEAHRRLLQRYRSQAANGDWCRLSNNGYIYRHLTWHLAQANWTDQLHALITMEDEQGQNAWFEACNRIGQPAIFVADVARGWALAEHEYTPGDARSIVRQCHYALITATLNSLAANLPIGMMAEFVKQNFWTVEQAWAYVEQMQNEKTLAEAIEALAPYLSQSLFQAVLTAARTIQDEDRRPSVLLQLATVEGADFAALLAAARAIQDEASRASVLRQLAKLDPAYLAEALAAARAIQDEASRAWGLIGLTQIDPAYLTETLRAVRSIQPESKRASVLRQLAKLNPAYFAEALAAARTIQPENGRAYELSELAKLDGADFAALLEAARAMPDEYNQAYVLSELAKSDPVYFAEALAVGRSVQDKLNRAYILSRLAKLDPAYLTEGWEAAQAIQNEISRASVLRELAKIDGVDFSALLEAAQAIRHENSRASILCELAKIDGADFSALLEAARAIRHTSLTAQAMQHPNIRTSVLSELAKMDGADFSALLEAARAIQSESAQATGLIRLAKCNAADFSVILEAARAIQDEDSRAYILRQLAEINPIYLTEALAAARAIRDEANRADALCELAKLDRAYLAEARAAAQSIQDEHGRVRILIGLAKLDGAFLTEALAAARAIQSGTWLRADILIGLVGLDPTYFAEALAAAQAIQFEPSRAYVLIRLAKLDGADLSAVGAAARAIQDESRRAHVLSELAKRDPVYFPEALAAARAILHESSRAFVNLAEIDGTAFSALLAAARAMQDERGRASVLSQLAKLDPAYFAEALAAVQATQPTNSRVSILQELAKVDGADFSALLAATRTIQDEFWRAEVLRSLAQQAPQDVFSNLRDEILALTHKPSAAKALSAFLPRLPLATLSLSDWRTFLRLLSSRQQSDLIEDLVALWPTILHLGGETAINSVIDVVRQVCSQWK